MSRRWIGIVASMLLTSPAWADGRLVLAGTEMRLRGERYGYLGVLLPLPGNNRLGDGWVQRYWLDGNRYGYDVSDPARFTADPQRIRARSLGGEVALGYHFTTRGGWAVAGYAGLRYSDTKFSPDDTGSRVSGATVWPRLQLEASTSVGRRWTTQNIASWTFGLQGYWLRSRWMHPMDGGFEVGGEVVLLGDRDYSARKFGLVIGGLVPVPGSTLTFRAGYHDQRAAGSAYCGIDVGIEF